MRAMRSRSRPHAAHGLQIGRAIVRREERSSSSRLRESRLRESRLRESRLRERSPAHCRLNASRPLLQPRASRPPPRTQQRGLSHIARLHLRHGPSGRFVREPDAWSPPELQFASCAALPTHSVHPFDLRDSVLPELKRARRTNFF